MAGNNKEFISFNVSARTARLIGRENVATPDGAIIELVKNTYDADSEFCIVFFDIPYGKALECIDELTYKNLEIHASLMDISLHDYYEQNNITFEWERKKFVEPIAMGLSEVDVLKRVFSENNSKLDSFFNSFTNIYIIDNGEGMNSDVIKKNWMTIGTDNKNEEITSDGGRTKSGAKGIGRFALDRLGRFCNLQTKKNNESYLVWDVDWNSFEQKGKQINEIYATIESYSSGDMLSLDDVFSGDIIKEINAGLSKRKKPIQLSNNLEHGTFIKISFVRDLWNERSLKSLKDRLESLVPPSEDTSFQLFIFNNRYPSINGLLQSDICEDFDYKIDLYVDSKLNVSGAIIRNEFRIDDIPMDFFEQVSTKHLGEKILTIDKNLVEMIPGVTSGVLDKIGPFSFTLYFMKRTMQNKTDYEKYYQKKINQTYRGDWLDNYGGIRIFRDNFRVRPYGEKGNSSWDWLELGHRVALNPAQVSRYKHWKVSPNSISGIINISRINNPYLEDKSSREGLQENDVFESFKNVLEKLIKLFEDDRSFIFSELYKYAQSKSVTPKDEDVSRKDKEKANHLATEIYNKYKERNTEGKRKQKKTDHETIATVYLKEVEEKEELTKELIEMREENSLLRVFASSGVTIASFTHELENLQIKLGSRFDEIRKLISPIIDENALSGVYKFDNPYYRLEIFEKEDRKLKQWLQYTLRTIRKDKRNQRNINIAEYFDCFKIDWNETLEERCVSLLVEARSKDYILKSYEIDLDCVFNNLIINSLDAFIRFETSTDVREIEIVTEKKSNGFYIIYSDSGPGLSSDIINENDIFNATFTTKRDNAGKEIGTGMGMWLVKKTLDQYNAKCNILRRDVGFTLEIIFP